MTLEYLLAGRIILLYTVLDLIGRTWSSSKTPTRDEPVFDRNRSAESTSITIDGLPSAINLLAVEWTQDPIPSMRTDSG
jgi:hypothetical protein